MVRWLGFVAVALVVATGFAAGCGEGVTDSEAKLRCNQAQQSDTACVTDDSYTKCVTCYEVCGDACQMQASCPTQFDCPE